VLACNGAEGLPALSHLPLLAIWRAAIRNWRPWALSDAPEAFIRARRRGITGIALRSTGCWASVDCR
jgi:hypothetical protein